MALFASLPRDLSFLFFSKFSLLNLINNFCKILNVNFFSAFSLDVTICVFHSANSQPKSTNRPKIRLTLL